MTATALARAAGLAAALAGLLFIVVQVGHPPMELASVSTDEWIVRDAAKAAMAVLALAGLAGIYLRHVRRLGVLGLVGWLVLSAGYLAIFAVAVIATVVLPALADVAPAYVEDVVRAGAGGAAQGDIGGMSVLLGISGVGYMGGGLLFGLALLRARVLARWAAALLAVSTAGTTLLAVLPESFNRPFAVPTGIALIGLGAALWREERASAAVAAWPAAAHEEPAR